MRALAIAAFAIVSCYPAMPKDPPPVPSDQCAASGKHLEDMGCAEARTPRGTAFAQACADHAAVGVAYPHACIQAAKTCAIARVCR